MYKQLNQASYLDKVVEMLDKVREEVIAMKSEVASTSTETVEETTATVGETEIIEHEGLKLKRVDREAREGDYVRVQHENGKCFKPNKIYGPVSNGSVKADSSVRDDDFEIADVYNGFYGRTPSTVEVFEVVDVQAEKLPFPEVELTANQKRAKLIENAKKFAEEKKQTEPDVYSFKGRLVEANFHRKNKRVTCVVNDFIYGHTVNVGRANCAPSDVFNEHIGKAIALARALEIDVPGEFLKAVQPTDAVVGMNFELRGGVKPYTDAVVNENRHLRHDIENVHSHLIKIIDDTNAQYEVV